MLYKRDGLPKKSATTATTTGIEEFLHRNKDSISCVNFYLILATWYIHKNAHRCCDKLAPGLNANGGQASLIGIFPIISVVN
jgi:hypothetical protein